MSIGKALSTCIGLIEEDLNRLSKIQDEDKAAFSASESRSLKDYLSALTATYKSLGGNEASFDNDFADVSLQDIERDIIERSKRNESKGLESNEGS